MRTDDPELVNTRLEQHLIAIKARIKGEFDNPALVAFGALSADMRTDILEIANRALNYKRHRPTSRTAENIGRAKEIKLKFPKQGSEPETYLAWAVSAVVFLLCRYIKGD